MTDWITVPVNIAVPAGGPWHICVACEQAVRSGNGARHDRSAKHRRNADLRPDLYKTVDYTVPMTVTAVHVR